MEVCIKYRNTTHKDILLQDHPPPDAVPSLLQMRCNMCRIADVIFSVSHDGVGSASAVVVRLHDHENTKSKHVQRQRKA